ncbi:hypothetical protein IKG38_03365 [Candidatus Saccharibacteria bacterium]|nr:hypothetical protein [Candidatus Saccharibacteria bacterium]
MENKKVTANPLVNRQPAKGPVMTKPSVAAAKPVSSASKQPAQATKPVETSAGPKAAPSAVVNRPNAENAPIKPTTSSETNKKTKKDTKNGKGKAIIIGVCIVVVIAIIIAIIIATTRGGNGSGEETGDQDASTPTVANVTEDEIKATKETLEKYAEVTVDGYKHEDGHEISEDIVKVHVKNISDEQTALHIVIVAQDKDGNSLDVSHLYAEGIRPGETQDFDAFVYTTLTPEQMKTATYKVCTAATYEVDYPEEEPAAE